MRRLRFNKRTGALTDHIGAVDDAPTFMIRGSEKRALIDVYGLPWTKGGTHVQAGTPIGFQLGLYVLALRVGWAPRQIGTMLALRRAEDHANAPSPGWWLELVPARGKNTREQFWHDPWAAYVTDPVRGLLRILAVTEAKTLVVY